MNISVFGKYAGNDTIVHGGGSGSVHPSWVSMPIVAIAEKYLGISSDFDGKRDVRKCNKGFCVSFSKTFNQAYAETSEVAIVFAATEAEEGADRSTLALDPEIDALID